VRLAPKRVLFVDHTPFVGGAQLVLAAHIERLDRSRFTPVVACTNTVPTLVDRFRAAGADVHLLDMGRLRVRDVRVVGRLLKSVLQLRRLIRTEHVDLVVSNTSRAAYVASLAVAGTGVPLVWWVRDFLFGRRAFNVFHGVPKAILGVSRAIRSHYGGDGDSRFHVVYVGSDLAERLGSVSQAEIGAERSRLGAGPDDVVIGFMGRLVADKGPEDLLAAVEKIHSSRPGVRLFLVGTGNAQEGDVEQRLREEVRRRGLSFVTFAGHQQNEALFYSMFDIFVLSTRTDEPYATSVVQAMMAGKSVVATATGGTPELVRDGVTGLLVPPYSPDRMAEALGRLIDDPDLSSALAANGKRHVLEHNREGSITAQAEAIYEAVLSAG
jgi:glycosyltransferase involved in cell wall biosynthesis